MKKQLEQHYQNSIFLTNEPGRSNIVRITDVTSIKLSEQWYKDRKENFNDEKVRIITVTAYICI